MSHEIKAGLGLGEALILYTMLELASKDGGNRKIDRQPSKNAYCIFPESDNSFAIHRIAQINPKRTNSNTIYNQHSSLSLAPNLGKKERKELKRAQISQIKNTKGALIKKICEHFGGQRSQHFFPSQKELVHHSHSQIGLNSASRTSPSTPFDQTDRRNILLSTLVRGQKIPSASEIESLTRREIRDQLSLSQLKHAAQDLSFLANGIDRLCKSMYKHAPVDSSGKPLDREQLHTDLMATARHLKLIQNHLMDKIKERGGSPLVRKTPDLNLEDLIDLQSRSDSLPSSSRSSPRSLPSTSPSTDSLSSSNRSTPDSLRLANSPYSPESPLRFFDTQKST